MASTGMSARSHDQCDQIWRNFATWANFNKSWANLWGFLCVWQNFKPTLAILVNFGQIWVVVSSQIMKNKIAIWSQCSRLTKVTLLIIIMARIQLDERPIVVVVVHAFICIRQCCLTSEPARERKKYAQTQKW